MTSKKSKFNLFFLHLKISLQVMLESGFFQYKRQKFLCVVKLSSKLLRMSFKQLSITRGSKCYNGPLIPSIFDVCQQRKLAKTDNILILGFQTSSGSRVRSFSSFSRVISDNARKVLQYTNVRAAELASNINSDTTRGSGEYCAGLNF